MPDLEIYDLIIAQYERGWEALYRKYNALTHRVKIGKGYLANYETTTIETAWADAIEDTCKAVRAGRYERKYEGDHFFLPFIIRVTQFKLHRIAKTDSTLQPLVPEISDVAQDQDDFDEPDMLMLHIAAFSLEEPYKGILERKYFPDAPELFDLTDEDICRLLEQDGQGKWNKSELGVYRRRAIVKMMKRYESMRKPEVEHELKKRNFIDFALLNLSYPVSALYALLFHQGKKLPREVQEAEVAGYLQGVQGASESFLDPRLRAYPTWADEWMKILLKNSTARNEKTGERLAVQLAAFADKFLAGKSKPLQ